MARLTVYVKPTCTTCKNSIELLRKRKADFETIDIFRTPPSPEELGELCRKLGVSPRDILRAKDPLYAELGLASGRHSDAELLALMSEHPGLIQRPIVVKGRKAVMGRPVETIETLLD